MAFQVRAADVNINPTRHGKIHELTAEMFSAENQRGRHELILQRLLAMIDVIEKQKTLMMLAMQGDSTRATLEIEHTVKDIQIHVKDQTYREILKWLTKVDPVSNHTIARAKHEPGTGEWFISSHEYSSWMLPGRSLWLHGIPGAGKTVLCSTIIENIKSRCPPRIPCVYFYFDFSDPQKQKAVNMLFSILAQLSLAGVPSEARQLYEVCCQGTRDATVTQLTEALLSVARQMNPIYIVIDALHECSDRKMLASPARAWRRLSRLPWRMRTAPSSTAIAAAARAF